MQRWLGVFSIILSTLGPSWAFDLQGHRGARGLMPENTLPGFAKALAIGVTTLELDTVLTQDGVVVVSHNPVIKRSMARGADGQWLRSEVVINDISFADLQQFDVGRLKPGSADARRFPEQQPVDGTPIPSLAQVFSLVEATGAFDVRFNIETKINPLKPAQTPDPDTFVTALLAVIEQYELEGRVTIQSFDWRTLQSVQQQNPSIATAYLSAERHWPYNIPTSSAAASPWTAGFSQADYSHNMAKMIKAAGGRIWSPHHRDLTAERIEQAHAQGILVIPWTVNTPERMRALIELGVDGFITDYPNTAREVLEQSAIAQPPSYPKAAAK